MSSTYYINTEFPKWIQEPQLWACTHEFLQSIATFSFWQQLPLIRTWRSGRATLCSHSVFRCLHSYLQYTYSASHSWVFILCFLRNGRMEDGHRFSVIITQDKKLFCQVFFCPGTLQFPYTSWWVIFSLLGLQLELFVSQFSVSVLCFWSFLSTQPRSPSELKSQKTYWLLGSKMGVKYSFLTFFGIWNKSYWLSNFQLNNPMFVWWVYLFFSYYFHCALCSLYCCAREMLVIPKNTDRSQSDATHSRVLILFKLAHTPNTTPSHRTLLVMGEPWKSIRARLYSKQQAGNMCASI